MNKILLFFIFGGIINASSNMYYKSLIKNREKMQKHGYFKRDVYKYVGDKQIQKDLKNGKTSISNIKINKNKNKVYLYIDSKRNIKTRKNLSIGNIKINKKRKVNKVKSFINIRRIDVK